MKPAPTHRVWIGLAGRMVALALLLVGLVDPVVPGQERALRLHLLLDASLSMGRGMPEHQAQDLARVLRSLPDGSRVIITDFARDARQRPATLASGNVSANDLLSHDVQLDRTGTDPAAALAALADSAPRKDAGATQILLVSDGFTLPDIPPGSQKILWLPTDGAGYENEVAIGRIETDSLPLPGQSFTLSARLTGAGIANVGEVGLSLDGQLIARKQPRADTVRFHVQLGSPGIHVAEVALLGGPYGMRENDRLSLALNVAGRSAALYVTRRAGRPAALEAIQARGWLTSRITPDIFPEGEGVLTGYDLVVLDDVPDSALSPAANAALGKAIRHAGLGMLVLGGEQVARSGGYLGTDLEELLPVISEDAARDTGVAVVFALDKSGSMAHKEFGVSRLAHAIGAVEAALGRLTQRDQSGLILFDREARLAAGLSQARRTFLDSSALRRTSPGGGTQFPGALELADSHLATAKAGRKLVVLVTDGVEDAPAEALARVRSRLARHGIDVVVFLIGKGATDAQLAQLRALSGNRVLRVETASELPRLVSAQIGQMKTPAWKGKTVLKQKERLPFDIASIGQPGIGGYLVSRLRPDARLYLESSRRDPVLTGRLVGAGRAMYLASGFGGAWAKEWAQQPEARQLVAQAAGWLASARLDKRLHLSVTQQGARLRLRVNATDESEEWSAGGKVDVSVLAPGGTARQIRLSPIVPGLFEGWVPVAGAGLYQIAARIDGASVMRGFHANLPELEGVDAARPHEDRPLAGLPGVSPVTLDQLWPKDGRPRVEIALQPLLLTLALLIYLLVLGVETGWLAALAGRLRARPLPRRRR